MGAFHRGHLQLMRRARRECAVVVVTLFVNPTQFGPNEDFDRYPRRPENDAALAEAEGVDVLFAPSAEAIYPPGFSSWVTVEGPVAEVLEGERRPGHFRGVCTVVAKLFHIVEPDRAYFGEKDYQQLQIVRKMTRELDLPIEIVACPTVRDPDGLALSSRNQYLNPAQREAARGLFRSLQEGRRLVTAGETSAVTILKGVRGVIASEQLLEQDYVALVDPETFETVEVLDRPAQLAVAARVGPVRLIDNTRLVPLRQ
jgi:pantoate--beta-alanine ligase